MSPAGSTLARRATASGHTDPASYPGILAEMGFQVFTSNELETDEYNFQFLNFPPDHPAEKCRIRSTWKQVNAAKIRC